MGSAAIKAVNRVDANFARGLERELAEAIKERDAEFDRAERHWLDEFRLREQLSAMRKRCEDAETNAPTGGEVVAMSDYMIDCKCKSRECHFRSMHHCAQEQWNGRSTVDRLERELAAKDKELSEAREVLQRLFNDHPAGLSASPSRAYEAAEIYLKRNAPRGGEVGR
jgi:hypothetical protein